MSNRELPHTLKIATLWLLAGVAVFLGIEWAQHRAAQTRFSAHGQAIEIRRASDGHYHWPGTVNGREVEFLIDTGATHTAISARLANELGLASLGQVESSTAGGQVIGQRVRIDLALNGGVDAQRLPVVALPDLGDSPLLGMDVLGRLQLQQQGGVLRIDLTEANAR